MHLTATAAREVHSLMLQAAELYGRGNFNGAASWCDRVLTISPDFPEALHLLGLCRWKSGDGAAGALHLLTRAITLKADDAQIWHNLGIVREECGDLTGARSAFLRASELNPGNAESYYNLGVMCEALNDEQAAETAYSKTFVLNGAHAGAASGLAAISESRNQLDAAEHWLTIALHEDPLDAVANLTRAQLDFRAGLYSQSAARLEDLLKRPLSTINRSLALGRLGMAYDRLGKYESAFDAFMRAKQTLREQLGDAPDDSLYGLSVAARMQTQFSTVVGNTATHINAGTDTEPVFLVGFPRSGTTLLDQILSSHSRVVVLEEQQTLRDVLEEYAIPDLRLQELSRCDDVALRKYRERYWVRVDECMPQRPRHKLFIDKLPLNTLQLPLIHCVFPDARIIFAVRDPRDVVLSCFMQNFEPNAAMRNFFSLQSTVTYYTAIMQIGRQALSAFPGNIYRIRYEDLVADMETETERLLAFLGLSWEPAVLEFHKTAQRRRINTPSYHQVTQPIYKAATQRWRNYAQHLQPVLLQLQPFVEYFGYT